MDSLRSCYRTWMRFPGVGLVQVQWYWTDFPPLPYTHVYGSHQHSREEGWDDWDTGESGEVWGAEREWCDGSFPAGIVCGDPQGKPPAWGGQPVSPPDKFPAGIPGGSNAVCPGYASAAAAVWSSAYELSDCESYGDGVDFDIDSTATSCLSHGEAAETQPETEECQGSGDAENVP